jgi:hypothetical protein
MKHQFISFLFCFFLLPVFTNAQAPNFSELRQLIYASNPDLEINDHLIAFNVWQMNDAESRLSNQSFEKAYAVYEFAKLKGGNKGLIVILFNQDNLSTEAVILLQKDGVKRVLSLPVNALNASKLGAIRNGVYSSEGQLLRTNLSANQVFDFIHSLITR